MLDISFASPAPVNRGRPWDIGQSVSSSVDDTADRERDLILRNMGLAEAIARRYTGRVGDARDIHQVALLGLVKAVRRFDPERGCAFAAFAAPTIAGEIKRYLRDTAWAVRPPRSVQELALSVNGAIPELRQSLGREPTASEIAQHMSRDVKVVAEAMVGSHGMFATSIDEVTEAHGANLALAEDPTECVERDLELHSAVRRLPSRDQEMLFMRFCEGRNQREIASELGLSQMQVSRAMAKALRSLRAMLEDPVTA